MKKIIILLSIISMKSFSQQGFKWDAVDSVLKTKNQIYSDSKMFIAENWKSAKDVIQNDDKEAGLILVKGTIKQMGYPPVGPSIEYYYSYFVTFKMKDNKFKISIDNVVCIDTDKQCNKIQPYDGDTQPELGDFMHRCLNKKQANELMMALKSNLQGVFDSYISKMKAKSVSSDW